jgi:DNA-binding Xre family transcriptional regulator
MLTPFGKQLRKHRIDKWARLIDMADFIGISPSHLSGIEVGKRKLTDDILLKICDCLKLTPGEKDYLAKLSSGGDSQLGESILLSHTEQ